MSFQSTKKYVASVRCQVSFLFQEYFLKQIFLILAEEIQKQNIFSLHLVSTVTDTVVSVCVVSLN